jgi:hypothetical protein
VVDGIIVAMAESTEQELLSEIFNRDESLKQTQQRVNKFRRLIGLVLGLTLAIIFALITQVMVRLEMPGVPLFQPPLGAAGNVILWMFVGAVLGLVAAWPEEAVYGVSLSSAAGTLFISIFTLFTSGAPSGDQGATLFTRILSLVVIFLPVAGMLAPLMILLRWSIARLTDAYKGIVPVWKIVWIPALLLAAVVTIGLAARLPTYARRELMRTQELIQTGLASVDRQSLPEALRNKQVGDFTTNASPGYTLEWDKNNVNRYGIPRTSNSMGSQEAIVAARFDNDWVLVCLYSDPAVEPACKGIGGEAGKAAFSNNAPNPLTVAWDDYSLFSAGLAPGDPATQEPIEDATVYHVEMTLPSSGNLVTGKLQARYTNREDTPLNEIYFRLYPNLAGGKTQVSNVKVDGQPVEVVSEQMDSSLKIPLAAPLQVGESTVVEMNFSVEVPETMGGNYGLLYRLNEVWALDAFLPTIAVYDENGWHNQPTPPNGDNTFHDASYYLVQVNAPGEAVLVASGSMVGGQVDEANQSAVFAAGPSRDFYLAASPHFVESSEQAGLTTVTAYSLPELADQNVRVRHIAAEALKDFNQRYGAYPYTELNLVSLPMNALGIEYPGVIGLNTASYLSAPGSGAPSAEQDKFRATIAHEAAHQWFYNLVGNDQANEPWLDEALAQYAVWQYIVDLYGDGLTAQSLVNYWKGCVQETQSTDVPVGLPAGEYKTSRQYVGAVYCRGPLFLAALRVEMEKANPGGVDEFDDFMKAYVAQNRWGIATTEKFRNLAEDKCGCDLGPLFDQWGLSK